MKLTNILRASATALAIIASGTAQADGHGPIVVTSTADSGAGSLRAALAVSNGRPIVIATADTITIETSLTYDSSAPLSITGTGQTISNTSNTDVLRTTQSTDITLSGFTLEGPGGFSITARDADAAGKGLFVDVPESAQDFVLVALSNFAVRNVAGHGIHVSDCDLADACGSGDGGAGDGSRASIGIALNRVIVENVGLGDFDADGLRVDERGQGSIVARISGATFAGVGADGVELDEGQAGNVIVSAAQATFFENGNYCDADVLAAFMPSPAENEFGEGTTTEDQIPGPVTGTADDRCIERAVDLYDDGSVEAYEFAIDFDDAFDIDEAGPGSIIAKMIDGRIERSRDEGVDFDEEGDGDIDFTVLGTPSTGNTDDGFKLSEADGGSITAVVTNANASRNGGKGFVFEEEDNGDVNVTIVSAFTSDNDDSDKTGLEIVQDDDGSGAVTLINSEFQDGIDLEGVDLIENEFR